MTNDDKITAARAELDTSNDRLDRAIDALARAERRDITKRGPAAQCARDIREAIRAILGPFAPSVVESFLTAFGDASFAAGYAAAKLTRDTGQMSPGLIAAHGARLAIIRSTVCAARIKSSTRSPGDGVSQ